MIDAIEAEDRTRHGVEGAWSMARRHVIRWAECDMYAHVNHAAYCTLFEDMRVASWLELGGSFGMTDAGPVVGTLEIKYLRPAGFNDHVLLTARFASLRRTSFVQEYAMWRDGLICQARALCVVISNASGEKIAIPPEMRHVLVERHGAREES